MLTWNRKGKGNIACMESDGLREDVEAELLQDSHTMVKAGLLEVQSPDGLAVAPPIQRLTSVLCCTRECGSVRSTFRSKRRASTRRLKAMKKTTYRVLGRIRLTERGIPYQSRDSRERSARSTLSRGKPGTRGRGTETIHTTTQRGA